MDLLRTAVVDITTLVATCHALKSPAVDAEQAQQRKLRNRLRREVRRGTAAYIDALARSRRGVVDTTTLATCRLAAEQHMPGAVSSRELLSRIMDNQAGSLEGLAAARQDLWRLAHMAIYLRAGMLTLRQCCAAVDAKVAASLASRLRRRLRKALIAYARAMTRTRKPKGRLIVAARQAALAKIGGRGTAQAERLADIEVCGDPTHAVIRRGVAQALRELGLDWQRHEPAAT